MASQAAALLVGVDTLIMNAKHAKKAQEAESEQDDACYGGHDVDAVPDELIDALNGWLDKAKTAGAPIATSWMHENISLMMYPHDPSLPAQKWLD